ncbi:MAG: AarF/ABC1/UbiB kinase family protein [Alphaproteobacteria bacterium]|nr:AarF/ABC1/UbiB kinase family protein [Alphaproteobacteria bacterium]
MAHIDVRDLGRLRAITSVLVRYGFGSLLDATGLLDDPELAEAAESSTVHTAAGRSWAARLRQVLVELGPTFVKLGQVLSVRPDIVPQVLIEELRTLQDDVPPAPWDEVGALVREELHARIDDVFEDFAETPVASASIAQVHFATLRGGGPVAVKVQRPGIQATIRSDLHILYTLAHLVEGRLELPGVYTPVAIVQEFEQAIRQELDFLQEASAAERFGRDFRDVDQVAVPKVLRRYSSSRLMVMERLSGRPLSTFSRGDPAVAELCNALVDATIRQVFDHGFFHADPHPGNLFVLEDGRLGFLDFGLCGTLTAEMRDTLITVLSSLVFQDAETLALTIYRVGGVEGQVDLRAFRSEIERMMQKYHGASLSDLSTTASLVEFVELASRYQIRLVPEYALLARAASIVDGILRGFVPDLDPVALVRPHASRLVTERLSPERVAADALKVLVQAQDGLRGLPIQLNQLLLDLERGRLSIITRDAEAERDRELLADATLRLSLALCAVATLISGAVLLAAWSPAPYGVPVAGIVGLIAVGGAGALWLGLVAHTLLGEHLRPRSLRRQALAVLRFFLGDRRR